MKYIVRIRLSNPSIADNMNRVKAALVDKRCNEMDRCIIPCIVEPKSAFQMNENPFLHKRAQQSLVFEKPHDIVQDNIFQYRKRFFCSQT